MRRLSSTVVVATLILSIFLSGYPVARAETGGGDGDYYVALGDSLSVGFQPGAGETSEGYVDVLLRMIRRQEEPDLALRNFGCAGETSRSLITGRRSLCSYAAGSQLSAAVAFLRTHRGEIELVTIDIGANDLVERCLDFATGLIDKACVVDLLPRLRARLAHILDALRTAAARNVPIVGMTYHNPFLGFWGMVPGGRALARANQRAWALFNAGVKREYGDAGAVVADVARTFQIDNFSDTVVVPGRGRIPLNVALACTWTWFCSEEFFGDPHPNDTGYRKIAQTFLREVRGLL